MTLKRDWSYPIVEGKPFVEKAYLLLHGYEKSLADFIAINVTVKERICGCSIRSHGVSRVIIS